MIWNQWYVFLTYDIDRLFNRQMNILMTLLFKELAFNDEEINQL